MLVKVYFFPLRNFDDYLLSMFYRKKIIRLIPWLIMPIRLEYMFFRRDVSRFILLKWVIFWYLFDEVMCIFFYLSEKFN